MNDDVRLASPLTIANPSRWTAVDFGPPGLDPAVDGVADEMEAEIGRLASLLPLPLGADARRILRAYPGEGRRFIDLFYRPVFSVLHWLEADPSVRADAVRVHALALFLHLWDDHLCDGQLPIDIVSLQIRGLAWQEMKAALPTTGPAAGRTAELPSVYLEAIHERGSPKSLTAHLGRFQRQIAIWRAAPLMLATRRGTMVADLVDVALIEFCLAWRMIDDIQDLAEDRRTGQDNCVRLTLDAPAAARWDVLRGVAPLPADADDAVPSAVELVLQQAREALGRACVVAAGAGLDGWAEDIKRARDF